ncbi:MAG: hypothetical protein NT150_05190 [Bacteroidetes bacterium]|nr:hypothetical protein [Bacteroidota bacterium]
MKTKSRISYTFSFILLLCTYTLSANEQTFKLSGIAADYNGPLNEVKITVFEESHLMKAMPAAANGKFTFSLDFNKIFKIIIEKDGYVSENISVNTMLPSGVAIQKMAHEISVKMFPVSEETPFTFEQAVMSINYNKVINGFTEEVNYKKTFHSKSENDPSVHNKLGNEGISADYKYQLSLRRFPKKEKSEEPLVIAVEEVKTESNTNAEIATASIVAASVPDQENKENSPKTASNSIVEPMIKQTALIEEAVVAKIAKKEKLYAAEPKKVVYAELVKKEVQKLGKEVIIEDTRQINKEVIKSKGKIIEFSYITYNNGGIYYFKNGACISAETYQRELKYTHQ